MEGPRVGFVLRRNRLRPRNGQENVRKKGAESQNGLSSIPALLAGETWQRWKAAAWQHGRPRASEQRRGKSLEYEEKAADG